MQYIIYSVNIRYLSIQVWCWCLTPLVILWQSVLLMDETGVPGENHRPAVSHWQTLSHNVVSSTFCLSGVQTRNVSGDKQWLHSL